LLGKRFRIGEVVCEGVRLCPPCTHLEDVTGKPVMPPLVHRGGIRARIVAGGWIRVGDAVVEILDGVREVKANANPEYAESS
jgi:MOSC domain-containing protein YiiM